MKNKIGRPRCEETKNAILKAAYELLLENGFDAVTVEGIAKRASVSKATIYKWWPNKAAVAIDGFFSVSEAILPIPDTGSVKEDLYQQVKNLTDFILSSKGKVITEFIAAGQFDADIAKEYQKRYFNPRRSITIQILKRGIERGELTKDVDIELCIDLIFAPIFYRILITQTPIDSNFIDTLICCALKGLA